MSVGMVKILSNLFWQFGNQAITILNGIFITAMVAGHLGPESFGILGSSLSVINIFAPLFTLSLDSILVREYLQSPASRAQVFWTAVTARGLMSIFIIALLFAALQNGIIVSASKAEYLTLCIAILSCLYSPLSVARLIFDAELSSKYVVVASNTVILASACAKIFMVANGYSLVPFALISFFEMLVIGIATIWIAYAKGWMPVFKLPSWRIFRTLLSESWPWMLSGLSVALYLNLDMFMLRSWRSASEAGIYSVVVRMSSIWYVIPTVLCSSFFPSLATLHRTDREKYRIRLLEFFSLNVAIAYACVISSLIVLPILIRILYGSKYEASIPIFYCHIFSIVFGFAGVARSQHLILERLHHFSMWATFAGMVVNVSCNCALIPKFGALGAAISTITGQGVAVLLSSAFMPRDSIFGLQLQSFFLKSFFSKSIFELRKIVS